RAGTRPRHAASFDQPVVGRDGYTMPATQHDLMMWIAGPAYDVVFDVSLAIVVALAGTAVLVEETVGWSYHRDLDLTGFIDGTENPSLAAAPAIVLIPDGAPAPAVPSSCSRNGNPRPRGCGFPKPNKNASSAGPSSTASSSMTARTPHTPPEPTRTSSTT